MPSTTLSVIVEAGCAADHDDGGRPCVGMAGRVVWVGRSAAGYHELGARLEFDVAVAGVGDGDVGQGGVAASAAHGQDAGAVVRLVDFDVGDGDVRHVAAAVLELDAVIRRVDDVGVADGDADDVQAGREQGDGAEFLVLVPEDAAAAVETVVGDRRGAG